MKIHFLRHHRVDAMRSLNKYSLSTRFSSTTILGAEAAAVNQAEKFPLIVMLLFEYEGDPINENSQKHSVLGTGSEEHV